MNHLALKEAMRRRRGKGLDLKVVIGDPEHEHNEENEPKDLAPAIKDEPHMDELRGEREPAEGHLEDHEDRMAEEEEHEEGMPGEDEMVAEEEGRLPHANDPGRQPPVHEVSEMLAEGDYLPVHKQIMKRAAALMHKGKKPVA